MVSKINKYLACLVLIFAVPLSAMSQDTPQDIDPDTLEEIQNQTEAQKKIEADLKAKRDKVLSDVKSLTGDINQMATQLSSLSRQEAELSSELEQLIAQKQTIETSILADKSAMTQILAALQRIESNPPPALAVQPNDAADAARAGLLMSGLNKQLGERVDILRVSLEDLENFRVEIETKQSELDTTRQSVQSRQTSLRTRVTEKNQLERSLSADYGEAQAKREALAAEAQSLQELINRLEYSSRDIIPRIKPVPNAPSTQASSRAPLSQTTQPVTFDSGAVRFSASKGKLYSPVTGTLTKKYSSAHPGISIAAAASAEVFAPAAGRVDFAGAFKNYGNVVIINVGDGYFVLLTGLGQLHVQGDSEVSAGDSVALMPVNSSSNEKLYIEVRKNGSTTDPVPWFGTTFAHVNNG